MKTAHDSETQAKGQQVITACAFIYHNFDGVIKVFLPKRAATKKFLPSVYELPGGHIGFGEEIVHGLKREIQEEFEMDITVGEPYYVFTYINKIKGSHAIEVVYLAEFVTPLENVRIHPEDHEQFDWFSEQDIDGKIVSQNKNGEDDEIKSIRKGFELLKRSSLQKAIDTGNKQK